MPPGGAPRSVYDAVIAAARPIWCDNGRDLLAALWRVAQDDPDRAVRVAARVTFGRCRDVRWVRDYIEQRLEREATT